VAPEIVAPPAPLPPQPVTQPPQAIPVATPQPQITVQPITPAVAAQLTVDMESLTNAVDKAYGRT
jgi:hypothetical protein